MDGNDVTLPQYPSAFSTQIALYFQRNKAFSIEVFHPQECYPPGYWT